MMFMKIWKTMIQQRNEEMLIVSGDMIEDMEFNKN